jgi:endonuclease I
MAIVRTIVSASGMANRISMANATLSLILKAAHRRGDIARIYFYFKQHYQLKISKSQLKLFKAWNKLDPVDQAECQRERRIAKAQGNSNPFRNPCRNS